MTRTHLMVNLAGIILPFVGLLIALGLLWGTMVGPTELIMLFVGVTITGFGITVGFHRLFTHRSFETGKAVRYTFAVLGQAAAEGDVLMWVSDHRKHHQFSDQEGDPHSPWLEKGSGAGAVLRGFWHAHTGWLFSGAGRADRDRYAKDLQEDPGLVLIARLFGPIVLASLAIPAIIGWVLIGGWQGAFAGLLWGGAVRIFVVHHITFCINSVCHMVGTRPYEAADESRNVWWLSIFSFGESWHNNHHAFPTSAVQGIDRFQLDPSALLIFGLKKVGLAWNVRTVDPARKAARRRVAAGTASP